jgi:hypothetical protein
MPDVSVKTLSVGTGFLTPVDALADGRRRLVAALAPVPTPQRWHKTDRPDGSFTLHTDTAGDKRYLTAEREANRAHVFTAQRDNKLRRQIWRKGFGATIVLGASVDFTNPRFSLQADDTLLACGNQLVVELVDQNSLGLGSEWEINTI